jgi:alkanesulfonate monooxygenase SsuD/methylene tetrahydromethanopterin reductase-like flavin-dependent oxidoreductase (luciferase family)
MDVGIGLPSMIPGVTRDELVEWARRAEAAGFSSLATLDRLVYPNLEPLVALGVAAVVTERIRLTTDVVLVPWRANAALIAKQALTVHGPSGGRLVLGAAVGGRDDDYEVSGVPFEERGKRFEEMLQQIKRIWAGEEVGFAGAIGPPAPDGPPSLLIGGSSDETFRRAAEYADGWTMGGGTPDQFAQGMKKLKAAWNEKGREGEPRGMALAYFGLGDQAEEDARSDLGHYYAWLGDELAGMIVGSAATDAETVTGYVEAFAEAGADEFILFPVSSDPEQVDLLAETVPVTASVHS